MEEVVVNKEGVKEIHKGPNQSKDIEPDELNHRVLKEFAIDSGPVFVYSFQLSSDSGELPKTNICSLCER